MSGDAAIIAGIFQEDGATELAWERATRCDCYTDDTHQPRWGCPTCGGTGVNYAAPVTIRALFRGQSRWLSFRREGEFDRGEAELTTPLDAQPGYTDRRVRDRYTVLVDAADAAPGRVFYPAAQPVPFNFGNQQHAWRVQLQSAEQSERLVDNP